MVWSVETPSQRWFLLICQFIHREILLKSIVVWWVVDCAGKQRHISIIVVLRDQCLDRGWGLHCGQILIYSWSCVHAVVDTHPLGCALCLRTCSQLAQHGKTDEVSLVILGYKKAPSFIFPDLVSLLPVLTGTNTMCELPCDRPMWQRTEEGLWPTAHKGPRTSKNVWAWK